MNTFLWILNNAESIAIISVATIFVVSLICGLFAKEENEE